MAFSISYSARKLYLSCPKSYEFRYIHRAKPINDPRTYMFGSIIGKVFEWFYEKDVWAKPDPESILMSYIDEAIDSVFVSESYVKGSNSSWEYQLKQDLIKFIPDGIKTIRNHSLLKPINKAELDLSVVYSNDIHEIRMVGRADFVLYEDPMNFWIMDGKASKHRGKYVDSEQLIWYAVSHYLKHGVAPKRIGFIFWMFPDDPITWINYTSDDMRNLIKVTCDVADKVQRREFAAKPSGDCHRCSFKAACEEGQQYISIRRRETGGVINDSIFDLETT